MSINPNMHGSEYFKSQSSQTTPGTGAEKKSADGANVAGTKKNVGIDQHVAKVEENSKIVRSEIQDLKLLKGVSFVIALLCPPLGLISYSLCALEKKNYNNLAADLIVTMRQMKTSGLYKADSEEMKILDKRITKLEHRIDRATRSYLKSYRIMKGIAKDDRTKGSGSGLLSRSHNDIIEEAEVRLQNRIAKHEERLLDAAKQGEEYSEDLDIAILTAPKSEDFETKLENAKKIGEKQKAINAAQKELDEKKKQLLNDA